MRNGVKLQDDGALVACEVRDDGLHTHMRANNVELVSPSMSPRMVSSPDHVHPFVLPPPWNRYLVPRDARFVGGARDTAALVARRVVETASACAEEYDATVGTDVAQRAAYSVPEAPTDDGSEGGGEEFDVEDEELTDDDEWEDAPQEDVDIDVEDTGLAAGSGEPV